MTIDRQRSCNSFDVYAMARYGGGLLVNIFSIPYFFTRREDYLSILFFIASNLAPWLACCPYDRRLLDPRAANLGWIRAHASVGACTHIPTCQTGSIAVACNESECLTDRSERRVSDTLLSSCYVEITN